MQPAEIERAITIKVEEAVRDIEGVEKIESTVSDSITSTVLSLYNDVDDVDLVLQEVKVEVDAIQDLPADAEKSTIRKLEPRLPVIAVALYGEGDESSRKRAARELRDDLLLLPGISDVQISGVRDDEISVEIRPDKLLEYNVTFDEIAEAIRQKNLDISGGELESDRTLMSIRTLGERTRGVDLENIVIRSQPGGRNVFLSDVAVIRDEFIDSDLEAFFNGYPAANCTVFKTPSQDAIQIAQLVKGYVAGKQNAPFDPDGIRAAHEQPWYWRPFSIVDAYVSREITSSLGRPDPIGVYEEARLTPLTHGFELTLHSDLSRFIEGRLNLMLRNGKTGLLLVLVSLVLFLNWRVAFWAAIGLPVSFLGTMIVMWAFGASLNLISLMGLILVLGIIVDDAIIIGENIFRHIENGLPPKEAAVKGAEEVMWPVTIAIMTTIAAFSPLLFFQGQIGDFMKVLPVVVVAALTVSLFEAMLILPAHLSKMPPDAAIHKPVSDKHGWLRRVLSRLDAMRQSFLDALIHRFYDRLLRVFLRWRYVTVAVAASTVIAFFGLIAGGIVETVLIQKMDSETVIAALEMPVGTPAAKTKAQMTALSDAAMQNPEIKAVQSIVGVQYDFTGAGAIGVTMQPHLGQLVVELYQADEREHSSEQIVAQLREESRKLSGVNSVTWEAISGGPGGNDIEVQVTGDNFDDILEVAEILKARFDMLAGVYGLDDNHEEGKREVRVELKEAARSTGITVASLGNQVRSAFYGREAKRVTRNREDVRIMVRYPRLIPQQRLQPRVDVDSGSYGRLSTRLDTNR